MWTLGTIAVFVALLVGLMMLSWLALNIIPRAVAVASAMHLRASAWGPAGVAAYVVCWVLLFPLMLAICIGAALFDWFLELRGQSEPAHPGRRKGLSQAQR